jgi:hypothetical protein
MERRPDTSDVVIIILARQVNPTRTLDARLEQLRVEGCAKIYREKQSGAVADRRELLKLFSFFLFFFLRGHSGPAAIVTNGQYHGDRVGETG